MACSTRAEATTILMAMGAEVGRLEPDPLGIDVDDVAEASLISDALRAEPAGLGDGAE
jgi:hypothetical protein